MRKTELQRYESFLKARQREFAKHRHSLEQLVVPRTADFSEEAQLTAEQDFAALTHNRATVWHRQVEDALGRIADGTYGTCLSCLEEIPLVRLDALPWAEYCINCQQMMDTEQFPVLVAKGTDYLPSRRAVA